MCFACGYEMNFKTLLYFDIIKNYYKYNPYNFFSIIMNQNKIALKNS